jgi:ribosomal protein L11 methyltransferase
MFVARLAADEKSARRIADLLSESLDPAETACAAFEQPGGGWQVDVHFRTRPQERELRALVAGACGKQVASRLSLAKVAPRDWVKESLQGLKPVTAGRFMVHGAHDRTRVPSHRIGIEIEAATAFGTGHHGTTRGCLLALDALARRPTKPRHIVDLGTGSGVLAIAAAKLFRVPVLATDNDPNAVQNARLNARLNGVGGLVTAIHAEDMHAREIITRAPFDLVLANILLKPLQLLAAPVARQLVPNARVVLSGILAAQKNAVLSAYRSQGMFVERSVALDGWVTPVMVARSL